MKKIKISELPLYQSLKGLFVMGTDANNRSVKVNLEFVETDTTAAIQNAEKAATAAATAAELASQATKAANDAALEAESTREELEAVGKTASDAAKSARNSSILADKAAQSASQAATAAIEAKTAAEAATSIANKAAEAATEAKKAADKATEEVLATIGRIVPTSLTVKVPERLTYGNVQPVYIDAVLSPESAMQNLIYISDNKSVEVSTDGRISIVGIGKSRVHVIPPCNTALAKSVIIEVGTSTLRLVSRSKLRFTQSGTLRMN